MLRRDRRLRVLTRGSSRLPRRLRVADPLEVGVLVLLAVLAAAPLVWLAWRASVHDLVWVGIDAGAPQDELQYVGWVREAGEHLLISNRFDTQPSDAVFLHPGLVLSGALTWLGAAPALAYLVWKPIAVVALFFFVRAYVHRLVAGRTGRAAGLVLALLFLSPAYLLPQRVFSGPGSGDLVVSSLSVWPVYPLWGYFYSALAVALMPATLLAYERDRSRARVGLVTCLLGLACSWLRPWQGVTVIAVILGAELVLRVTGRPSRPALRTLGATLAALVAPLAYYFVLSQVDPAWETAQSAFGNTIIEPAWWTVALAIAPLAVPAVLAYRRPPADFQHAAVRVWPFASLSLVWLIADGGVSVFAPHALQGLSIPLAVLAVNGLSSLQAGPASARARIAAWAAIALLIVPSTADAVEDMFRDIDSDDHPYFLEPSERHALTYLDNQDRAGAVLAPAILGAAVPALTGRHTRVGHLSWTPGFFEVRSIIERFFAASFGPVGTRAFVDGLDVRFILSRCAGEASLTSALRPMLASVHRFGCATVYTLGHADAPSQVERTRLVRRGGQELITLSDGNVPIDSGAPASGLVEHVKIDRKTIAVAGWALDRAGRSPDYVLAFAGDQPLASATPAIDRPDVAASQEGYPLESGFRVAASLPLPSTPGRAGRIRVFAVAGGEALEVPFISGLSPILRR